jgi:hypothetical protein
MLAQKLRICIRAKLRFDAVCNIKNILFARTDLVIRDTAIFPNDL